MKYIKCRLLSKHFFQRKQQYGGWKNLRLTFVKNLFQLPHGIKNIHQSKLYLQHTHCSFFCFVFFGFFCSCSLWRFASRFDLNRITNRSKHRRCSVRKGVLRNFANTEKHMCQSLFFNKVADCRAVGARGAKGDCPALQLFEYYCCLLMIVKRNWRKLKF